MPKQRRLVIDIGTNSVLALLAEVDNGKLTVISDRKKTTRLGEGLQKSRKLKPDAIKRTVAAISEFKTGIQFDRMILLGTEALRIADNAAAFADALKGAVGCAPIILSGQREAELAYFGALYDLDVDRSRNFLIDVGGGSTELVAAHNESITDLASIPIGALKLKESAGSDSLLTYQGLAEEIFEREIGSLRSISPGTVIATGGTVTSLAAIRNGLTEFDSDEVHGTRLERDDFLEIAARFEMADRKERLELIPFDPERANLILPGLGIFLAIMGIISQESLVVSAGGIRFGAALSPQKI